MRPGCSERSGASDDDLSIRIMLRLEPRSTALPGQQIHVPVRITILGPCRRVTLPGWLVPAHVVVLERKWRLGLRVVLVEVEHEGLEEGVPRDECHDAA